MTTRRTASPGRAPRAARSRNTCAATWCRCWGWACPAPSAPQRRPCTAYDAPPARRPTTQSASELRMLSLCDADWNISMGLSKKDVTPLELRLFLTNPSTRSYQSIMCYEKDFTNEYKNMLRDSIVVVNWKWNVHAEGRAKITKGSSSQRTINRWCIG